MLDGRRTPAPAKALRAQLCRDVWWVFVQWHGLSEEEATWELLDDLRAAYPDFQLEDKLFQHEGRDVMTGVSYSRRRPTSG